MAIEVESVHRWSYERFAVEQKNVNGLVERFLAPEVWQTSREPLTGEERAELREAIAALRHPMVIEELCAMAATHPRADVRLTVLEGVEPFMATLPAAREFLVWLLGDDEDFVVFSAAKIAGRHRIGEAYEELLHITGPAEAGLLRSTKPVGIGAAVVAKAMDAVLGAEDRAARLQLERE
ncbi:MAG TPA: hypothetical protein VHN99_05870, partial [Deinococcales bacterium]|nr:hypothetical protein [Deinococcales bacterium]